MVSKFCFDDILLISWLICLIQGSFWSHWVGESDQTWYGPLFLLELVQTSSCWSGLIFWVFPFLVNQSGYWSFQIRKKTMDSTDLKVLDGNSVTKNTCGITYAIPYLWELYVLIQRLITDSFLPCHLSTYLPKPVALDSKSRLGSSNLEH